MKEMLERNSGRQGLFVVVSPFGRGRLEKLMRRHMAVLSWCSRGPNHKPSNHQVPGQVPQYNHT
jgi:hypothetical protein